MKANIPVILLSLGLIGGAVFALYDNRETIKSKYNGYKSSAANNPVTAKEEIPITDDGRQDLGGTDGYREPRLETQPAVYSPIIEPPVARNEIPAQTKNFDTTAKTRVSPSTPALKTQVRKPEFLSREQAESKTATQKKFGLVVKPVTNRKTTNRKVTDTQLFKEQEKARKVFDSRSINNF